MLNSFLDLFAIRLQNIRMWIKRKYEKTIKSLFSQFPVIVLTGARQVGKTALVRKVFPKFSYVSLDVPALSEQAEHNPNDFFSRYEEPLIIDEVQYAPSLFRHLKGIIDQHKKPGRFILTGSQNFSLMQGVSESLAGRCGILNMHNLSFRELKETIKTADSESYFFKGGFPELYEKPEIEPAYWYSAYLATYLERDIRNISNVGNLRDFNRFLRATAMRTGQILSYSELARDIGIAPNTAKKWISILQASGQIQLIEPYHRNLGKRLIKSPKLYMCDTGLAAFLMGFEKLQEVMRHPVAGALWETYVVMQVVRHYFSEGRQPPLWYWRTVHGAEVDLLIEKGGEFIAIEVKTTENPDKKDLKGIQALQQFYGDQSLTAGYIASRTSHEHSLSDMVKAVHGSNIDKFLS